MNAMRALPRDERTLFTCRVLPAARAAIYNAFADPHQLTRWWGPAGFRSSFHSFDFVPNGRWLHTLHGPDDTDYANDSRFVELMPNERIVLEHLSPPWFELTVTLAGQDGGTRIGWRQTFADAETCARLAPVCVPSNEQNLDRLAAVLSGGVPA